MKPLNNSQYFREYVLKGSLESVYIIDCHTHMGPIVGASTPIFTMDECVELMRDENIKSIWCAPHTDLFCADNMNADIESYMEKYPEQVFGYYSFNPNYAAQYESSMIKILQIKNYIGFKFLPVYHNTPLDSPNYLSALEFADKYNLIVLSHTWGNTACSPKEVETVLKRFHNLQFIMGHSSPNELDHAIELVKKYDNVYLDLCDIHRHSGIVDKMCNAVGAEKILFGTDLPWYDPNYCIGSILCAHISDDNKEKIFHKNAERMLSLISKNR